MTRTRLFCAHEVREFEHSGFGCAAGIGFDDGRLGEIFVNFSVVVESVLKTTRSHAAAIITGLTLQHGVDAASDGGDR